MKINKILLLLILVLVIISLYYLVKSKKESSVVQTQSESQKQDETTQKQIVFISKVSQDNEKIYLNVDTIEAETGEYFRYENKKIDVRSLELDEHAPIRLISYTTKGQNKIIEIQGSQFKDFYENDDLRDGVYGLNQKNISTWPFEITVVNKKIILIEQRYIE